MARGVPSSLERLHQLCSERSADPLTCVLTLLFLRALHDEEEWGWLRDYEPERFVGLAEHVLSLMRRCFPHHFQHDDQLSVRLQELNHGRPTASLVEQTDKTYRALTQLPDDGDVLGAAYMFLLPKRQADWNGEFYTPWSLALTLAKMNPPGPGETVYDPACGSGRLLWAALAASREQHGEEAAKTVRLYGVEINPRMAQIARLNSILHGCGNQTLIATADALAGPAFITRDGEPATFDVISANPPFGTRRR